MKKEWETKTIGDVCEFQRGLTYAKGDEVDVSDNVVLRATNIDLATNLLIFDELKYINEKVVIPESKKIKKGSLMICMASGSKSHLGKVAFIDDDYGYAFGGFMGMLTPLAGLLPKYLFHLMTSEDYKDFIGALSDGANINNLTFDKLKVFPVPLPPLPEQRRIVGILDEAFAGLATAKANAGKNLQNARALFESHLNDVFIKKGEGWVEKRLADVSRINYGYTESASSEKVGPHFLRITDIQDNRVDWATVPYCRIEKADLTKYKLADGDIVFARTGATTGKSYLVSAPPEAVFASYLIRVQLTGSELSPQFLNLFFQTQSYWDTIRTGVSGSAQGGFNATKLGDLEIPLPNSPKEQQEVVAHLDALSAETRRLAAIYERKLAALAELKKSLLHQAFAGEL
jgi:type I restriction enzyme, S subunit